MRITEFNNPPLVGTVIPAGSQEAKSWNTILFGVREITLSILKQELSEQEGKVKIHLGTYRTYCRIWQNLINYGEMHLYAYFSGDIRAIRVLGEKIGTVSDNAFLRLGELILHEIAHAVVYKRYGIIKRYESGSKIWHGHEYKMVLMELREKYLEIIRNYFIGLFPEEAK
jgi:hypothetical protein